MLRFNVLLDMGFQVCTAIAKRAQEFILFQVLLSHMHLETTFAVESLFAMLAD